MSARVGSSEEPVKSSRSSRICFQCRNRKVRCNGALDGCENCIRLGFPCSFSEDERLGRGVNGAGKIASGVALHLYCNSGMERRRGWRACLKCRAQKSRCSGEVPSCHRCRQRSLECVYTSMTRKPRSDAGVTLPAQNTVQSPLPRDLDWTSDVSNNHTNSTEDAIDDTNGAPKSQQSKGPNGAFPSLTRQLGPEKEIIENHIKAFFEYVYPIPGNSFIHRALFLQNWTKQTHNPILLKAMCGASARFISKDPDHERQALIWSSEALSQVLKMLAKPSVVTIQSLLLIIFTQASLRNFSSVMALSALTARMAFTLRLNYEERKLPFTAQECRRRVMWAIFVVDTFYASGQVDLSVCPIERMQVQLPCNERCFAYEIEVETELLRRPLGQPVAGNLGLLAYLIRIFDIRYRIQCFSRTVVDSGSTSQDSDVQLHSFEQELELFMQQLPETYSFSRKNLALRAPTPQRTSYVMLHIWWHQCYCDLFRFAIPRIRESLPFEVLQKLHPDFISHCQDQCWRHAMSISSIVDSIRKCGGDLFVTDSALSVCLFQTAQIITQLGPSLPWMLDRGEMESHLQGFIDVLGKLAEIFPSTRLMRSGIMEIMNGHGYSPEGSVPQR
ncbi:fungal-specific transcription factor domain-containing protein [Lipomyces starkeyi]|uniref:Zn(2)-C6 fungal-type domain-containing protein n=1 Tax=Lipomyces starkeyi NRRL Y-11557 TaxID=675824 RepID=A0A1E3Q8A6_LIPST|nr:hypothetical protein LIPSTDRAFT_71813 [Lipomyces starkeyi NRRL Y-11557]